MTLHEVSATQSPNDTREAKKLVTTTCPTMGQIILLEGHRRQWDHIPTKSYGDSAAFNPNQN